MLDPDSTPVPELIQDDRDSVKEDAVITGGGELEQNKTTSEKCGPLFVSSTRRSRPS
jgi:hypothetical protein